MESAAMKPLIPDTSDRSTRGGARQARAQSTIIYGLIAHSAEQRAMQALMSAF
jgi:hypothetical protein